MRKELRVLGIDDGPFFKFRKGEVLVVGTFFRGGNYLDGLLTTKARVDGRNATTQIANMVNNSKFKSQLRAILLDGVAVGGFNVIDLPRLHQLTNIPVIAVIRRKPDVPRILKTLKNLGMQHKAKMLEKLPEPVQAGKIHIQPVGISIEDAKEIINITTTNSDIPEPIRVAHIIAAGLVIGESRGRA